MKDMFKVLISLTVVVFLTACASDGNNTESSNIDKNGDYTVNFNRISPTKSGIHFINQISEDFAGNFMVYDGYYQGAGVGVGDINNDGLSDLYFAGNNVSDKLYLNKGNFVFEDITAKAGITPHNGWSTGVTFGDVNGDGWQDIYVCQFLWQDISRRPNKLYINNGDGTFTERAKEFGLNDPGLSTNAVMFDYDKDNDLDLYVANQAPNHKDDKKQFKTKRDYRYTGRLYRNEDNKKFTDVTGEAGLVHFGFGLGVVATDLNNDGWTDLYCAMDFDEPDLMFSNNGNGTFTNKANESLAHMSNFSMGVDIADINNDGWMDFFVADMVAPGHERIKTQMSGMNPKKFYALVDFGYHHQYMYNSLQVNNGNGRYSEVSQLAGVSSTDWSWTTLFVDLNLDGHQDLFISNGHKIDSRDNDYNIELEKFVAELKSKGQVDEQGVPKIDALTLLDMAPSVKLSNFAFENGGDYTFQDRASEWGLGDKGWSHGGAYADLDNDGDLDLVLNNMDEPAGLYRNESKGSANYLIVNATNNNGPALNVKVQIATNNGKQYREITPYRGYMSCSAPIAHFGLGNTESIDELTVIWTDGTATTMQNVKANQSLSIDYASAKRQPWVKPSVSNTIFALQSEELFSHIENEHNDFEDEILLPHKVSTLGPCLAIADLNGDGLDDAYAGGANGQAGALLIQNPDGSFTKTTGPWEAHASQEDISAIFFDTDGDGDEDLYIASGGNEMQSNSGYYKDRMYINNGSGNFSNGTNHIPDIRVSTDALAAGDYDRDGDIDLFVGGRQLPNKWPYPVTSFVLENDGNGNFAIAKNDALKEFGMVTDAQWVNLDDDEDLELVTAGEWMPIKVLDLQNGAFVDNTAEYGLAESSGWWNTVKVADIDNDGDMDLIAGNLGKNIKYKASAEEPFKVYSADFDENGSNDIYLGYYEHGNLFPVRGRQCSSDQMPFIKEKFPTYNEFAAASVEQILGPEVEGALILEAKTFESSVFVNNGDGVFKQMALPNRAQFSTIQDMIIEDFDNDGDLDILAAGNYYNREVETRRSDGSVGLLLLNDGVGNFSEVPPAVSGFNAWMDARAMGLLKSQTGQVLIVANNNGPFQLFDVTLKALDI